MRRVVITGIGAVTPLGNDAPSTWSALRAGRSGIGPLTRFDCAEFDVRIAGEVKDFDLTERVPAGVGLRHLSRAGQFGLAAAHEAVRDAGDPQGAYDSEDIAVVMGASVGRPDTDWLLEVGQRREASGRADDFVTYPPSLSLEYSQNAPAAAMARMVGASGPMIGISTACAGSAHAVGEAFRHIQDGDATMALAGGFDSLTSWVDVLGFSLLGALSTQGNDAPERASRPFDADRTGFVVGEGAVVLVLEERCAAIERGAMIYAEVTGYGTSLNAWRITDSPPDGSGAAEAIEGAVAESRRSVDDVDIVVAHGTSTLGNDSAETRAIHKVFGDHSHQLLVTAPKSMTGHMTGAAAGLNVLVAVLAMRDGVVPPTANLDQPASDCDLDYVPRTARQAEVRVALANAFAFGGMNACLILEKDLLA